MATSSKKVDVNKKLAKEAVNKIQQDIKLMDEKMKLLKTNVIELNKAWHGTKGAKSFYEKIDKIYDSLTKKRNAMAATVKELKQILDGSDDLDDIKM